MGLYCSGFHIALHCSHQKPPKAVGYPDGVNMLYKAVSVAEFITSDKHLTLLAGCSKLEFDRRSEVFARHPLTTETMRLLCDDVKVLGPTELRQLVSGCGWFMHIGFSYCVCVKLQLFLCIHVRISFGYCMFACVQEWYVYSS